MTDAVGKARAFIQAQGTGVPGQYIFCPGGKVSLYASCYAAMARHYIGGLDDLSSQARRDWCEYINGWQHAETGYFLGPELAPDEFTRPDMDATYVRLHLAIHVLPTLEVLGGAPVYPLTFARVFADPEYLSDWLRRRNWRQAWLEGNNLLFAGQLLVYLRDKEGYTPADDALNLYFNWLDQQQDPATGLWGTNGFCDTRTALYGGYHQLLVYYACGRPVKYAERIIDTVLALQQPDGSFSPTPGGGACEDVDAVDVLVNLVKRTGHRTAVVRQALASTIPHILRQQAPDGGFVYRWGRSYMQSGVLRTFVPTNQPDIFSTWFRLHTLALINEVAADPVLENVAWNFNHSCSMGWHDRSVQIERVAAEPLITKASRTQGLPAKTKLARRGYGLLLRLPTGLVLRLFRATLVRYLGALPAEQGLRALLEVEQCLDRLGQEKSYELGGGLDVRHWWSQSHQYYLNQLTGCRQVVHLGCGDGSLSFTLASQSEATIVATDFDSNRLAPVQALHRHPRLAFVDPEDVQGHVARPDMVILTDLVAGRPAWERWQDQWCAWPEITVLAQISSFPSHWRELSPAAATGVVTNVPIAQLERLAPEGWRVVEATSLCGALHARLRSPGKGTQIKGVQNICSVALEPMPVTPEGVLPQVSVVMSVYNGERYLRQAIESVLAQAFVDFEFIIIDDGSNDRSAEIIRSFGDSRILLVSNEINVGLADSLNRGISLARGSFIARQDADDVSERGRFPTQVAYLEQHKDVGVVGLSAEWIDSNGDRLRVWPLGADNPEMQSLLLCTCPLIHGSVMFRRQCIEEVGAYNADMRSGQDYDLWLRLAEKWDVVNLPDVLYRYRWHDQMVTATRKEEQQRHADVSLSRAIQRRLAYGKTRMGLARNGAPEWVRQSSRRWLARRYVWWSKGARMLNRHLATRFLAIALMLDPSTPEIWQYLAGIVRRKTRHPIS